MLEGDPDPVPANGKRGGADTGHQDRQTPFAHGIREDPLSFQDQSCSVTSLQAGDPVPF